MVQEAENIKNELETIKRTDKDFEYWSARELMPILGYKDWRKFKEAIKRAQDACKTSNQTVEDHFVGADKLIIAGKNAHRRIEDYLLTRYASYLVAQNGDPRKPEIAYAQTYFAIQTRRQEINDQRLKEDKRLEARARLRDIEKKIGETVYTRGIRLPREFATFKNRHIEALYGGIGVKTLKKIRGIPEKRALADFDTHLELRAKDFALAMTDHNIKDKNLIGRPKLEGEVVANSRATRKTLLERGIKPEELKPEEDLKKIEQKRIKESKLIDGRTEQLSSGG